MIVSNNTIQVEGLSSFFKNLGRIHAKAGKKLATNILKNPGRTLEISSNIATAPATKSPKAALSSLPEMINSYNTAKGLYQPEKLFDFIPFKWNPKQKDYIPRHPLKVKLSTYNND